MSVVARTTSSNAAYWSRSRIASRSPIVAKIKPTSPRGIMPRPMRRLSPGDPAAPTAAMTFPARATASRPAPMASTDGSKNDSTLASMPIWRKNTGMKRWPTGASSRVMRSETVLRDNDSPATNAPTIGASCAASASSANASVNASASATTVPVERA